MNESEELLRARSARLSVLRQRFLAANLMSPSLRLRQCSRRRAVDLSALSPAALSTLSSVLGNDNSAPIPLGVANASLQELFHQISLAAHEEFVENGSQHLAIGWPFLEGKTRDGLWLRAPLFLYPAALAQQSFGRGDWTLQLTAPPEINEGLLQLLLRSEGVRLRLDDFLQFDEDGIFRLDSPTWKGILRCFHHATLSLDAPETLPELQPLEPRSTEEREALQTACFTLSHQLVLGLFPRSGSNIAADYEKIIEKGCRSEDLGLAADVLLIDESATQTAAPIVTENTSQESFPRRWQVVSSDDSQDTVFRALSRQDCRGLVVQGPPGTGKSQLIANLVSSAIGQGKRVLLACQKRAALDVVCERLESLGLREPLALVHDISADRAEIVSSLEDSIARLQTLTTSSQTSLQNDQQLHEQALLALEARSQAAQKAFITLRGDHPDRPGLARLQELALDDDLRSLPRLQPFAAEITETDLLAMTPRAELLQSICAPLAAPHPLSLRGDFSTFDDLSLHNAFEKAKVLQQLLAELASIRDGQLRPDQAAGLQSLWQNTAPLLDALEGTDSKALSRFLLFWSWTGGRSEHGIWSQVVKRLERAQKELRFVPYRLILEPAQTLTHWAAELRVLEDAKSHWYKPFLGSFWRTRKLPEEIAQKCRVPLTELPSSPNELSELCLMAIQWQTLLAELPHDHPLLDFGLQGDMEDIDDALGVLEKQNENTRLLHVLHRNLRGYGGCYAELPDLEETELDALCSLDFVRGVLAERSRARLFAAISAQLSALTGFFGTDFTRQIQEAADSGDISEAYTALSAFLAAAPDREQARQLDIRLQPEPLWLRYFLKTYRVQRGVSEDIRLAVERAWRHAALAGQSAAALEAPLVEPSFREQLATSLAHCQGVANRGVMALWKSRLLQFSQQNQGLAFRQLAGQLAKKRNRPTLRQLVEQFWDNGLSLLRPVWCCSPEVVSTMFPLHANLFDLLIFDEASQCPVEAAVPVLLRGQRAVIAGDDQQMPPSHFFQMNHDEENEDEVLLLDSPSLLALARVAFPGTVLSWHYRSRHEELIAFSNEAFYGGQLTTAPRAEGTRERFEGLHWQQIQGRWEEQKNEQEAAAIVAQIEALWRHADKPSIGVIAMNRKQAECIEKALSAACLASAALQELAQKDRERPPIEQLFVRNLENVQGDERDVILLSVGYAPDARGRVQARFGPLTREGGEKRLNVAVTRARRGMWIFCSFLPEVLEVENTKSLGPKLLKAYLRFAKACEEQSETGRREALREAARLGGAQGIARGARWQPEGRRIGERMRDELCRALEARGIAVQQRVGLGSRRLDLALQRTQLGIDCCEFWQEDDPLCRDVYVPNFWNRAGWKTVRVSPAMWLEQRDALLAQLIAAAEYPM